MTDTITVHAIHGEARADSRELARALGNHHENVLSLISDYRADFEALGLLRFETGKTQGRGRPPQYALLSEDQCYFLLTLVRNSETTVPLKRQLVQAFAAYRRQSGVDVPELPTDPVELLALSLQGLQQHRRQLAALEHRLDTAPIRASSEMRSRVHAACQDFGRVHPRGYSGAYRAFKEAFGFAGASLAAYDDLPQHRFGEALGWLDVQVRTFSAQRPLLDEVGD
ncbi:MULTISPECIES: Rha family transcriptional regulator [Deinococcus]|uniref:Rha family transcriptional regulator n=1 Tax=Deinococcus rufus TaxID=2136097 RepID=A0ABV7ZF79_9DEIO|nr:Rha family transcriptional regulator [Deinococcus sp. AB2017081]WQE94070.1 Rha family transcriptional regulator [Deinococcus sp. AB2017081]